MKRTTNVSCVGDADFRKRLGWLAEAKSKDIGELVREAIDALWGDDLKRLNPPSFFAEECSGAHKLNECVQNGVSVPRSPNTQV